MSVAPATTLHKRSKNYQHVAVIEIALIFFVLVMGDLATAIAGSIADKLVTCVLLVLEGVYLLLLLRLSYLLSDSKKMHLWLKISAGIIFILSLIALNPFISIVPDKVPWLMAVHLILCSVECIIIALGLKDIYSQNLHITERLWGSVSMYLLIALGWGSLFELLVLAMPASLGVILQPGYQSYAESLYQSLCSLSGTGSVYTSPSHILRNLSLIESVWGVLFLVMLIGRLFSLPSAEKPGS